MTPTTKRCVITVRQRPLFEVVKVVQLGIGSRRVRNAVKNEDKLQLSHFKVGALHEQHCSDDEVEKGSFPQAGQDHNM